MKRKPTAALLLAPIAAMFCASPVSADELDAGSSDPTPPPFSAPAVPADTLSWLAFTQAINSLRSFAGMAFLATRSCGLLAISEIGAKSLRRSKVNG